VRSKQQKNWSPQEGVELRRGLSDQLETGTNRARFPYKEGTDGRMKAGEDGSTEMCEAEARTKSGECTEIHKSVTGLKDAEERPWTAVCF